jgi:hypothetical protein
MKEGRKEKEGRNERFSNKRTHAGTNKRTNERTQENKNERKNKRTNRWPGYCSRGRRILGAAAGTPVVLALSQGGPPAP